MAPGMAIAAHPILGKKPAAEASEVAELRRRNSELEREVSEGRAREEGLRRELERTRARLRTVEDAEERLSAQLGELEAEAVVLARSYQKKVKSLSDELARTQRLLLDSSRLSSSSTDSEGSDYTRLT